jgi:hypothetical protein
MVRLQLTFVSGYLCPVSDTQFQEQFTLGEINDINVSNKHMTPLDVQDCNKYQTRTRYRIIHVR